MRNFLLILLATAWLAGCSDKTTEALGTLEWDSVNSRAVQSEVIEKIFVREGDRVEAGTSLLRLDNRKQEALVKQLEAELQQAIWYEKEMITGPRQEEIAEARARLASAKANLMTTDQNYKRQSALRKNNYISQEHLENVRNDFLSATSQVDEHTETLNKLLSGTRIEKLEQAKAQKHSLEARLINARLQLEEYLIKAPRKGVVDSLPYKLGDRPPMGAVVCTILSGNAPWARVYIPQPWRSKMKKGDVYQIKIDGRNHTYSAQLRSLEAKANFTPYFALTEKDRSYLSYVAELDLTDKEAKQLSAGTPLQLLLEER